MATATSSGPVPETIRGTGPRRLGRPELALILVGVLFFVIQQLLLPRPFGFSTDEATYLAKVDPAAPELYWTEPRAWGVPVLAFPVAIFSAPLEVVRLYFSVLSSVVLVGAFWPWRRVLHPAVAPLGAFLIATTWWAIFLGPQPMPNLFVGLGAVAVGGLFLRAVQEPSRRRTVLAGLAVAFVALVRPTDSVLVVAPMVAIALFVPRLRRFDVLGALVAGGVLGWMPWIVEAFVRYGDPISRLRAAEAAGPKGLGLNIDYLLALPRLLDGNPYYLTSGPPSAAGDLPFTLTIWLAALVLFVGLGLAAARAQRRLPDVLLVTVPAVLILAFYLLLPSFTSIRFLVPGFALLSVPVATAIVFGLTVSTGTRRKVVAGVVALGLAAHAAMMLVGAYRIMNAQADGSRLKLIQTAEALEPLVEREACLIVGREPQAAAYYLGCRVIQARPLETPPRKITDALARGEDVVAVLPDPPEPGTYLDSWRITAVEGLPEGWAAYLPPV